MINSSEEEKIIILMINSNEESQEWQHWNLNELIKDSIRHFYVVKKFASQPQGFIRV